MIYIHRHPGSKNMNTQEIAKLVEETDNLDNNLLNDAYKKQKTAFQLDGEIKKKVVFKEFDEDDPLADLLSDEETFHQENQKISASSKNNLMADLFGLKTSDQLRLNVESNKGESTVVQKSINNEDIEGSKQKKPLPNQTDWLGLTEPMSSLTDHTVTEQKANKSLMGATKSDHNTLEKSNSDGKLKLPQDKVKKSMLMEDLFGNRGKPSASVDLSKSSTKLELETDTVRTVLDLAKVEQSPSSAGIGYAPTISTTREPRRGRRTSVVIDDPLGLLSASTIDQQSSLKNESKKDVVPKAAAERQDSYKKNTTDDLPEWLGGTKSTKDKIPEDAKQIAFSNTDPNRLISPTVKNEDRQTNMTNPHAETKNMESYPDYMSILFGSQFDQQAAIMTMQQQEHELRTATTLSQQNQQLSILLEKQKSKLDEQEKQFNMLIKKQIERQILLETQMKVQQERINHYIQTLMAQPSSTPVLMTTAKNDMDNTNQNAVNNKKEPESLIQKLQLDKTYLENTLDSLKENHEKEIAILEESYRKQIFFLEAGMEKLEKRMQEESERLETDYKTRIEKLIEERVLVENTYKEQIEELKNTHKEYIDEINLRHASNLQLILKEHAETIENIYKAKNLENQAIDQITTHKTDIQHLLKTAHLIIENITSVQVKIDEKDMKIEKDRENYLKVQEENIELQKRELEQQTDVLGRERKKVVDVANKLDVNISQLTTEFHNRMEENKQTEERLKIKEEFLIRERELFEEKIKWERQHLQDLKDSWMKEQERQLKALADERETRAAEKAKLEVFNKLKISTDDAEKLEVEATLKAAQDAVISANRERQKWIEKINQLQAQQQCLQEKENHLMMRAKELEDLTQSALLKREEGLRALKEAKRIENQHKEKLQQLQTQLEALAQRENRIATEKLSLARERLALRAAHIEKPVKETNNMLSTSEISTHFKDIVDPHLLMLKLNLDNQ